MEESQITLCFPNDNTKRIDYVIFYKYSDQSKDKNDLELKNANRNKFLNILEKERIIIYKELKLTIKNQVHKYILLHCPTERLLQQAEKIKLEMRIKNVNIKYCKIFEKLKKK